LAVGKPAREIDQGFLALIVPGSVVVHKETDWCKQLASVTSNSHIQYAQLFYRNIEGFFMVNTSHCEGRNK
jgi:hypothetical protein